MKKVSTIKSRKTTFPRVEKASQTPRISKCPTCDMFTDYTRQVVGSITSIMKHLSLETVSQVVQTFPKLPTLLNTETQTDVIGHWLKVVQQDMDFLEKYAMRMTRPNVKQERERLRQLERSYKYKMREVWRTVQAFQGVLQRIAPPLLSILKTENEDDDLSVTNLKKRVESLNRDAKNCELMIKVKYEPKIKALQKQIDTVTNMLTSTAKTLLKMEERFYILKATSEKHQTKYEIEVRKHEKIIAEKELLRYELEHLKQKQKQDAKNFESINELKQENKELKETLVQTSLRVKSAMQLNYKLTKQLAEEKQMRESLLQLKDQLNREIEEARLKVKTLEEINTSVKEKLRTSSFNLKDELAERFNCELSDVDDVDNESMKVSKESDKAKGNLTKVDISNQGYGKKAVFSKQNSLPSPNNDHQKTITGNPFCDIKNEIVSNYKLIKQLEEEILTLNKLRLRIKEKKQTD